MPKLNRPGATIHWEEQGAGSPLLLVMGTRMSSRMWYPILPLLARHHRVITFDNRGSGQSSPSKDFTITDLVDDALAVLDAAGVESAHVYGVSLGRRPRPRDGHAHPERVTSLILGCVGPKTEVTPESKRGSHALGPHPDVAQDPLGRPRPSTARSATPRHAPSISAPSAKTRTTPRPSPDRAEPPAPTAPRSRRSRLSPRRPSCSTATRTRPCRWRAVASWPSSSLERS